MFTDMYIYTYICIYMDDIEIMKGLNVVGIHTLLAVRVDGYRMETQEGAHTQVLRFN